jgi:hypothetical protein
LLAETFFVAGAGVLRAVSPQATMSAAEAISRVQRKRATGEGTMSGFPSSGLVSPRPTKNLCVTETASREGEHLAP